MTFTPGVQFYQRKSDGSWTAIHSVKFEGQGGYDRPKYPERRDLLVLNPDGSWTDESSLNYSIKKGKTISDDEHSCIHDLDVASWIEWTIGFPYKDITAIDYSTFIQWRLRPVHPMSKGQKRWAVLAWSLVIGGVAAFIFAVRIESPTISWLVIWLGILLIVGGVVIMENDAQGF